MDVMMPAQTSVQPILLDEVRNELEPTVLEVRIGVRLKTAQLESLQ
jgi:hypothetical protein